MVQKIVGSQYYQVIFRWTYFLLMIRALIILFSYITMDEFIFSGLGIYNERGESDYNKARSMY